MEWVVVGQLGTVFGHDRSLLGIPLTLHGRVMGLVALGHGQPDYYGACHAELALSFCREKDPIEFLGMCRVSPTVDS